MGGRLVIDPSNRTLFLPTAPLQNISPLPPDPISMVAPATEPPLPSTTIFDTRRLSHRQSRLEALRTARISMAASRAARRRAAQSVRLPSDSYFAAMRVKYKHAAAAAVDLIAGMAAAVGFPAPAVIYAVVVQPAMLESIPCDCVRKIVPRGGPLVVTCETWIGEEEGRIEERVGAAEACGWWVEVAVSEDGSEIWATAGAAGRMCRRMHANFVTGTSDSSESSAGCAPMIRYSPGF